MSYFFIISAMREKQIQKEKQIKLITSSSNNEHNDNNSNFEKPVNIFDLTKLQK